MRREEKIGEIIMPINNRKLSREDFISEVGQVFKAGKNEYRLEGKAGDGAIGFVRKATNLKTNEQVGVKFLSPEFKYIEISSLEDICARFKREGQRGVSLDHDNLVKIMAYEDNENSSCFENNNGPNNPFIVMEYINGKSLERYIKSNESDDKKPILNVNKRNIYIAHCITSALLYLHERNLIHRDVKPANIFLSKRTLEHKDGVVKLGDFGIVKWGDFKASISTGVLTLSGQQGLGTFKYMSPEQATNPKDVSVRSDMYSLGITLYELFTTQILPSQHHVFQIMQVRMQRGTIFSKLHQLGLGMIPTQYAKLLESILDMFLTGTKGRPSSKDFYGKLSFLLERLEEVDDDL